MIASRIAILCATMAALSVPAWADQAAPVSADTPSAVTLVTVTPLPRAQLSDSDLSAVSGGNGDQFLAETSQNVNGSSSDNSITANEVTTGNINFNANALSGFAGIGNFVVNSGNNDVIQGTMNVSIIGSLPQ